MVLTDEEIDGLEARAAEDSDVRFDDAYVFPIETVTMGRVVETIRALQCELAAKV